MLQLFTEYKGKIVNIRRVGTDAYHILTVKPTRLIKVITREEVLTLSDYNTFTKDCKPLIEDSMDPDFIFNDIEYKIKRV